jgi:exodeoxyribonuclease VII large subunit
MVRLFLDDAFGKVQIEGEISNLARPRSGHIYFSLKDDKAQVRCAWFRPRHSRHAQTLKEGDHVCLHADVSLFEPRGDYQLIVDSVAPAGIGDLAHQFEQLKQKLLTEGLFDPARKKPLPTMPNSIGLITSATGAAIRDLAAVLERRFPLVTVSLYPSAVQGQRAPAELIDALRRADKQQHDVLILARGGGSLEDLQAFNDENLARAIAACKTPLVSGVGHETDVTITDLVADHRAATPSVAAESAVPDAQQLRQRVTLAGKRLAQQIDRRMRQQEQYLDHWQQRLRTQAPSARIQRQDERLANADRLLKRATAQQLTQAAQRAEQLSARLQRSSPQARLPTHLSRVTEMTQRLKSRADWQLSLQRERLAAISLRLDELSPLRTLARGYSVVRDADKRVIRDAHQVSRGQALDVILEHGKLVVRVDDTTDDQI